VNEKREADRDEQAKEQTPCGPKMKRDFYDFYDAPHAIRISQKLER
jgi:hypothetical protein